MSDTDMTNNETEETETIEEFRDDVVSLMSNVAEDIHPLDAATVLDDTAMQTRLEWANALGQNGESIESALTGDKE